MAHYKHVIFHMGNPCPEGEELFAMSMHPQKYFEHIGLTYAEAEPRSFFECWHLFDVDGFPDDPPDFWTIVA